MEDKILFGLESIEQIVKDAEPLYVAVSTTLGGGGRNCVAKNGDDVIITKDGVTVAKLVEPFEKRGDEPWLRRSSIGGSLLRTAANKTNEDAGDGTTSTTVIAYELIKKGLELFKNGDFNQVHFSNGVKAAAGDAVKQLENYSKEINEESLYDVCMVSSNGDEVISKAVVDVISTVGENGHVSLDASNVSTDSVSYIEGIGINKGWFNNFFSYGKSKVEWDDSLILVIDDNFEDVDNLRYFMDYANQKSKNLVIIANDFGMSAQAFVGNAMTRKVQQGDKKGLVMFVKAPFFMEKRSVFMDGLAKITGATLISQSRNNKQTMGIKGAGNSEKLRSVEEVVGHITKMTVTKDSTILKCEPKDVFVGDAEVDAILKGKTATINIGGSTEVEQLERYDRYEDTLNTARSAIKHGVVVGAGMSLYRASEKMKSDRGNESFRTGYLLLMDVLKSVAYQVANNAGYTNEDVDKAYKKGKLINVNKNKEEMINKSKIVDSCKAVTASVENASSLASTVLTVSTYVIRNK
jgi:chaperonin GroEL